MDVKRILAVLPLLCCQEGRGMLILDRESSSLEGVGNHAMEQC